MTRPEKKPSMLLPALVKERERELKAREERLKRPPEEFRICNATMDGTTYRTGDGEVLQHPRPGSMRAFSLPSHGGRT